MQEIILIDFIGYNIYSTMLKLTLALIVGLLVGIERELKHQPAGIKTHTLVCIGSCLVVCTTGFMVTNFDYYGDVFRLGAQVISGIGFLGAGTIMVTGRNQIKGLTTAAGLWYVGCAGLAIGYGFYSGAIYSAILVLIIGRYFDRIDNHFRNKSRYLDIYLEYDERLELNEVLSAVRVYGIKIINYDTKKTRSHNDRNAYTLIMHVMFPKSYKDSEFVIDKLTETPGVYFVEKM